MSMKIKYWNVTLIVCILPVYLYVWSFKLPHTLRDYHSTLNHAVQRVFIQYKCCLVDVSQWMIHNKTLLTYHRRWKQNDNSRLQVHLCCRLRESSPSIKFVIHCLFHCLYQTWVSYDIPVLVEPLDDAKDFFILAESRLASKDLRLPVWENKNWSLICHLKFGLSVCTYNR